MSLGDGDEHAGQFLGEREGKEVLSSNPCAQEFALSCVSSLTSVVVCCFEVALRTNKDRFAGFVPYLLILRLQTDDRVVRVID